MTPAASPPIHKQAHSLVPIYYGHGALVSINGGHSDCQRQIGMVTGKGLAENIRDMFPRWLCLSIVFLLLIANTINIAADIAAMGAALRLVVGGGEHGHAIIFAVTSLLLQIFIPTNAMYTY